MTFGKLKTKLILLGPILLCFDAFYLFSIDTFYVTLSVLCCALIVLLGFLEIVKGRKIDGAQILLVLFLMLCVLISGMFGGNFDLASSTLYIFYFVLLLTSHAEVDERQLMKQMKVIERVYTFFSVFAIYQFFAYLNNWSFSDITIEGHMTEGFNTGNLVYLGDFIFMRAHSIYLEPSSLSQFAAVAIILSVILYRENMMSKFARNVSITINLIAIILSVSGTGLLVLVAYVVYYWMKSKSKGLKHALFVLLGLIVVLGICTFTVNNTVFVYIRKRILEAFDAQTSGGMRFTFPYLVMLKSFVLKFFGFGAGNEYIAITESDLGLAGETLASGYAKIGCELGLIGFVLFIVLLMNSIPKYKNFKSLYLFVLLILFVGGNMLQAYFWIWFVFVGLNVNTVSEQKSGELENRLKYTKRVECRKN